jgi:catalase
MTETIAPKIAPNITAKQMLDAFKLDAPEHVDGTRWAHTHGIGVMGHFKASNVARNFCVAEHFNGEAMPVTIRLSNGSSLAKRRDNMPDTRGMAVKFHYPDGQDHDMLAMTLSVFGSITRENFMGVSKAFEPKEIEKPSWFQTNVIDKLMMRTSSPPPPAWQTESGADGLAKFAGTHSYARGFVIQAGLSQVPASWARTEYHTVHTFMAITPEGRRQPVRFTWQPVDGVFPVPADELDDKSTTFLTPEMRKRLAVEPSQFTLRMTLGDPGDELNNPSQIWPVSRRSINMGTLVIERLATEDDIDVETLSFNPLRLPPGIEPSDDEILRARGEIYQLGCAERHGTGCPLHTGKGV